jgi:hypothetical protein
MSPRLGPILILALAAGVVLQGCITMAVISAVRHISTPKDFTAIAEISVPEGDAYAALVRVVESRPDLAMTKRHDTERRIEVMQGNLRAEAHVTGAKRGQSVLTIVAHAGASSAAREPLALGLAQQTCAELGSKCRVIKEEG